MRTGENKNGAFKRLAANRTNVIIKNLRLLGNLSNKHNYSYSDHDFRHIFDAVEKELKLAKARFTVATNKNSKFRL